MDLDNVSIWRVFREYLELGIVRSSANPWKQIDPIDCPAAKQKNKK